MSKREKNLRALLDLLRSLRDDGVLEPERAEAISAALKRLRHAIRVKDFDEVSKAVDAIARALLK